MPIRLVLALILICASCAPSVDDRIEELVTAKNLWVTVAGQRSYTYALRFGDNAPYTVSVSVPGTLREDWLLEPSCPESHNCRAEPTIPELFQLILDLNGEMFHEGGKLEVSYDETLGYPRRILWDDDSSIHSETLITVSEVVFSE